jgi:hypothetical protein
MKTVENRPMMVSRSEGGAPVAHQFDWSIPPASSISRLASIQFETIIIF